jgi:RND family efflux transporter MFP subunit
MAPEQLVGGPIDARADVYAMGVILAEMISGRHPLQTPSPTLPPGIAPIVVRALQPDPAARYANGRELLVALENSADSPTGYHLSATTQRWWWEFHQAAAALLYWLMVIPAWQARGAIGGAAGRTLFIVTLAAVIVAANLRLHLWFTSRFYPRELKWLRARVGRLIHVADWVFALALIAAALLLPDAAAPLAILLLSFGIGAAVAFLVIERATARAAFRTPLLVALVATAPLSACAREQPREVEVEEQVIPVAAQRATLGDVRAVLHVSGLMTPAPGAELIVTAPEPARIVEITKNQGEAVAAVELLVRFDIPSATSELARQRADLARAQADLENARMTQARNRDLAQRGLIARREQEDADRVFTDAQAAVTRAEATLRAAEQAAARTTVRAPFTGVIVQRLHNPGDLVQGAATDPILRLVDPRRLEVAAQVAAGDLARILPGATARLVGLPDGKPVALTVASRPGPNEVGASGMATVRLVPQAAVALDVDAPVQVDIDLGERSGAVVVSPDALVRAGANTFVYVASGDRAERREVTTGIVDETRAEITAGVRAGELVIVRGQGGLEEGARISVDVAGP